MGGPRRRQILCVCFVAACITEILASRASGPAPVTPSPRTTDGGNAKKLPLSPIGSLLAEDSSSEEVEIFCEDIAAGMHVVKRDGRKEPVMFDKITARISRLCKGLDERYIDPVLVAQKVVQGMYSGVTTSELDTLAAETCAYMNTEHPDYARLAARISVSNLQRDTSPSFAETMLKLRDFCDPNTGENAGLVSDDVSHASTLFDLGCDDFAQPGWSSFVVDTSNPLTSMSSSCQHATALPQSDPILACMYLGKARKN
jgi:hypothetical protein